MDDNRLNCLRQSSIYTDVTERWRGRELLQAQSAELGQYAAVLSVGIDTLHFQLAVDFPTLRNIVKRVDAWADDPPRVNVRRGSVNRYAYTVLADGLSISVPSMRGVDAGQGLWIIAGAAWCLRFPLSDYSYQIGRTLIDTFDLDAEHYQLKVRRFDPRVDFAGDGLDPYCDLSNVVCHARKRRQVHGELVDDAELFADDAEDVDPDSDFAPVNVGAYGSVTRFTGITAGKSSIFTRVYDKVVESERGALDRWRDVSGVMMVPPSGVGNFRFGVKVSRNLVARRCPICL